jgi:hypothetical protein
MIRAGGNPMVVAKHMGHRGLASIDGYAEIGLDSRQQLLEAMDVRIRDRGFGHVPPKDDGPDDEDWGVADMFTELRWNYDANGSVTREELERFAELARRPDLIEQAAMTTQEFVEWCEARGGWWPLEGTDWRERQSAWARQQLTVLGPE